MNNTILVTGGAGFIGSSVVRMLLAETDASIVNLDKLTYSGHSESLTSVQSNPRYVFERGDICDAECVRALYNKHRPYLVMHLAAESHVDRSIGGPEVFVESNVKGTYQMLEAARAHWSSLSEDNKVKFRFLHVSTDEVYGQLGDKGYFKETSPYQPSSPYSASKAASDHLVRAWKHTYNLPTMVTNCSNNYGPYQFPEKLIPVIIASALADKPIPIYGEGKNVRDWLYVEDHVRALMLVAQRGKVGETYLVGGNNERTSLQMAQTICGILNEMSPRKHGKYEDLISFVTDRAGHDWRYAIDSTKLQTELGWKPKETFETGIKKTVAWYLENQNWCATVLSNSAKRK